ncbi:hypothetical protein [Pengzhenrongella frigida]|uniref:Uncharacterized protein n=1 Tax=Pengzhenrongella frigida TaxID=1259133 RepID=A0A4Q5N730_9MICO|nr:hypothetical protein [Cellulomonas sp. HLT2-17]RYV52211.1 hypothetical protein EUA98_04375 [Cellulomonas sp. HLT2-17]
MQLNDLTKRALVGVTGVVAVAALLTGCGASDRPDPAAASQTAASDGEATGDGAGSAEKADSDAYVDDYDPEKVLIEHDYPLVKNPEDITTVGVESLVVEGKTMTLRLVVSPTFDSQPTSETVTFLEAFNDTFRPVLLDRTNLKQYSIVGDQTGVGLKTDMHAEVMNGGSALAWFVFAAPEDDIETIDLQLDSSWPEIRDVPITR